MSDRAHPTDNASAWKKSTHRAVSAEMPITALVGRNSGPDGMIAAFGRLDSLNHDLHAR